MSHLVEGTRLFSGDLVAALARAMLEVQGNTPEEIVENFVFDRPDFFANEEELQALLPVLLHLARSRGRVRPFGGNS